MRTACAKHNLYLIVSASVTTRQPSSTNWKQENCFLIHISYYNPFAKSCLSSGWLIFLNQMRDYNFVYLHDKVQLSGL